MCTADVPGAGTVACGWACGRDCTIYAVDHSLTPTQCAAALTKLIVPAFWSLRVFLEGLRERPSNDYIAGYFSMGTYPTGAHISRPRTKASKNLFFGWLVQGLSPDDPCCPFKAVSLNFEEQLRSESQSTPAARF